jgi:hypothetical protein
MNDFDLKKFLVENKLTTNSRISENTPSRFADKLARLVYDENPSLTDEDQVISLGHQIGKSMVDRKTLRYYFSVEEDFLSDFITAYRALQKGGSSPLAEVSDINEQGNVDVDDYMRKDGDINLDVFYRADNQSFDQASKYMTAEVYKTALDREVDRYHQDSGTPPDTTLYLYRVGAIISTNEVERYHQGLEKVARLLAPKYTGNFTRGYNVNDKHVYVELKDEVYQYL